MTFKALFAREMLCFRNAAARTCEVDTTEGRNKNGVALGMASVVLKV